MSKATRFHDQDKQVILHDKGVVFRDAMESDIDDITTVVIDAFSPSPDWYYNMPQADLYPNNIWHCTREQIATAWTKMHNTTSVKVVSVPVERPDRYGGKTERVVALGVWNILNATDVDTVPAELMPWSMLPFACANIAARSLEGDDNDKPPYNCSKMLGYNVTRSEDFKQKFHAAKVENIDEMYRTQLYLNILATHPDWDGHGFAAMNCHWGEQLAKGLGIPLTLIATPAGYPLYHSLGWESVKNITIEKLDGLGSFWFEAIKYVA